MVDFGGSVGINLEASSASPSSEVNLRTPVQRLIFTVEGLRNTQVPPLVLLVNPSDLSTSYEKMITTTQTRGGFAEEHWGDHLDVITGSGSTLGFFLATFDENLRRGILDRGDGATNQVLMAGDVRRDTPAYQNFIRLLDFYSMNASVRGKEDVNMGRVVEFGRVILAMENAKYIGFFEEFSYREVADMPFRMEYDFTYKVTKTSWKLMG